MYTNVIPRSQTIIPKIAPLRRNGPTTESSPVHDFSGHKRPLVTPDQSRWDGVDDVERALVSKSKLWLCDCSTGGANFSFDDILVSSSSE